MFALILTQEQDVIQKIRVQEAHIILIQPEHESLFKWIKEKISKLQGLLILDLGKICLLHVMSVLDF